MDKKYVVIRIQGLETAFLFPGWVTHADVARGLQNGLGGEVVSAGFFSCGVGYNPNEDATGLRVSCWGESISLRIKSRLEDERLVRKVLAEERY